MFVEALFAVQLVVDRGIAVDFDMKGSEVSFAMSDAATHAPLKGVRPAAWLSLQSNKKKSCNAQAAQYLAGDLFARADVDLNRYYVLSLNDDATISVVDPLFGFGGSKLLAQIDLDAPGDDWTLDGDQLFVSMPSVKRVAQIDTKSWRIVSTNAKHAFASRMESYSSAARLLYRAKHDGTIEAKGVAIHAKPGIAQIRFAPNGRYLLIANPEANLVQVVDAATNRIIQNASISDGPDQITFSEGNAYVRRRTSETILVIPLEQLGRDGAPISVADFPGGQHAYGEGAQASADSIVRAPDALAMLVANPADKMIYYYKEGMAAPMGGFSTYGKQPRAVLVVDRGLRETQPGRYATDLAPLDAGTYDVVFFNDNPRVVACFTVTPASGKLPQRPPVAIVKWLDPPTELRAGEKTRVHFALTNAADANVLALEAPGIWQQRGEATRLADGTYTFEFTPPERGIFYLWVNHTSSIVLEAR